MMPGIATRTADGRRTGFDLRLATGAVHGLGRPGEQLHLGEPLAGEVGGRSIAQLNGIAILENTDAGLKGHAVQAQIHGGPTQKDPGLPTARGGAAAEGSAVRIGLGDWLRARDEGEDVAFNLDRLPIA
jgi:hypothetical protein